jgi:arylsulfatase A-like enzyme
MRPDERQGATALMGETGPTGPEPRRPPARSAVLLAAWFGLVGGYTDVLMLLVKKDVFHASLYYNQGRHFFWTIPLACLAILAVPGLLVVAVNRLRPGLIPLRAAGWLFATLALWEPLLRTPLAGAASLVLAAGLGRWFSRWVAAGPDGLGRWTKRSLAGLAGLLAASAAVSLGWQALGESRAAARLPQPSRGAKNVLLIVLDTVRAGNMSLHGYGRDTTPNLVRWAQRGVRFDRALAPAPWTLPSHGTLFTGRWPYELNLHWQAALDATTPTLAGYLGSRGFQTAGFAANTNFCSYESGLNRGFDHFEDYPLTAATVLGSTAMGRWLATKAVGLRDAYALKWVLLQSRGARGVNSAFLDWLSRKERPDRPFFAFLNYFDAHEPFVLPEGSGPRFGLRPESPRDRQMLVDYWDMDKSKLGSRDLALARDAYDDCIAYLDRQVGALLDELERRGVLRDTLVVITSDHGESFGEHGIFNHGYCLYLPEVQVPLMVIPPAPASVPSGTVISEPVSLRDLPATVVDLLGLAAGSPFPGRSVAGLWCEASGPGPPPVSPALSEVFVPAAFHPRRGRGPAQRGYAMSLVAGGRHYTRDGFGGEELFDLQSDPGETRDVKNSTEGVATMNRFRRTLLQVIRAEPATRGMAVLYLRRFATALGSLAGGRAPPP